MARNRWWRWSYWQMRWDAAEADVGRLVWHQYGSVTEIPLESVTRLEWRAERPMGEIRLWRGGECWQLSLAELSRADRLAIIRLIRREVSEQIQENWPKFCDRVAVPLRRFFEPPPPPQAGDRLIRRRNWDVIFGLSLIPALMVVVLRWRLDRGASATVILLFLFVLWVITRLSYPREGILLRADSQPPGEQPAFWTALFSLLILFFVAVLTLKLEIWDGVGPFVGKLLFVGAGAIMGAPLLVVWSYRKRRAEWLERRVTRRLTEWEEGEEPASTTTAARNGGG